MAVHDELGQTQDLTAQVEGVAEAGLLALFGGQSLQETKSLFEMSMTQKLIADYKEQTTMVENMSEDLFTAHPEESGLSYERPFGISDRSLQDLHWDIITPWLTRR